MIDAPSWWWADLGGLPAPRPALDGDREADVCIVGGGYTGLWTAYYLREADPSLGSPSLEREFAGFGASGRNGGWLLGELPRLATRARPHGARPRSRLQRAMLDTVDEVAPRARPRASTPTSSRAARSRGPTPAQSPRLRAAPRGEPPVLRGRRGWPSAMRVAGAARRALDAALRPHAAGQAARGPGRGRRAPRRRRSTSARRSPRSRPEHAAPPYGTVRARYVVRATEGFTAGLQGPAAHAGCR